VTLRRTRAAIREATPTRRRPASQGTTPLPCLEESWAGWPGIPGGGIAARRRAGDVSQGSRACAGLLAVRGFGVDALAFAAKGNRRPIRNRVAAAAAARLRGPPS
jgi:hypothetical protein